MKRLGEWSARRRSVHNYRAVYTGSALMQTCFSCVFEPYCSNNPSTCSEFPAADRKCTKTYSHRTLQNARRKRQSTAQIICHFSSIHACTLILAFGIARTRSINIRDRSIDIGK